MASAAVQMLTLDPCRKIMVFNTDLGLDSDTDTEMVNGVGGKRAMSETEEDQDKGHVKKRRKQSKPVRIASSESHSDGENYRENGAGESGKCELPVKDGGVPVSLSAAQDDCKEENLSGSDDSLLPINLSNAKCVPHDVYMGFAGGPMADDLVTSSYQESVFVAGSSSPLAFGPAKSGPMHGVHMANAVRHSGSPVRIFNPEAFCDLCNKEFCNKYFLKTHKANKHGIYSDNTGPNLIDTLPTLPFINYFSSVAEVMPPNNGSLSRTVLRKPPLPTPLPQPNPLFLQKAVAANGNTRAFCNICQREFCNKYFVRRHKAKIHGIIDINFPDTPPSETQEQKNQNATDLKMCGGNHDKSEDHEIYVGEQQMVATVHDGERADCRPCENKPPVYTNEHQQAMRHAREPESDESASSGMIGPNSNLSPSVTTGSMYQHDDIGKTADAMDKMRRAGVPNSEAFCDICCKEYCNKYFLRTHKMKSHGILQTESEKRDERQNMLENSLSQCYSQNMPLNLIVGDQNADKTETYGKDVGEENGDIFCNVCGQKFKNVFLLKMHTSYMHPQDAYEKPLGHGNDSTGLVTAETVFKAKPASKTDSNSSTEPVNRTIDENSVMLKCEICHKAFDPASLEAHIETEHGNLLDDVATIGEENSDSQVFAGSLAVKYDCLSCHKQFTSTNSLNQHIIECHGAPSEQMQLNSLANMKAVKDVEEPTKIGQMQGVYGTAEIQPTPTSSFCEICKKELCNKYFMKTHMQRMHGISIDNGAHIGGVVCDICNKELCSKYFLRVHKQNSHGIVDEILGLDISRNQSPGTDPSLRPTEQNDLNNRYFSHFTEVCTICSRRFRSMKWLKAHLLNDHGDEGKEKWKEFQSHYEVRHIEKYQQEMQKKSDSLNAVMSQSHVGMNNGNVSLRNYGEAYAQKFDTPNSQVNGNEENLKSSVFTTIFNGKNTNAKQYHCSYCPFSTSILAFLFVHERSHINGSNLLLDQNRKFQCKVCSMTFENDESYEKHCISHTLSEITGPSSSCTNQNDKLKKTSLMEHVKDNGSIEMETPTKDISEEFHKDYYFKASVKCAREVKSEEVVLTRKSDAQSCNETRQDFVAGQGDMDFLESYDGPFSEDSRKEYVTYEKHRHEVEANEMNGALTQVKQSLDFIANKTDIPVSFSVPQTQKQVIMQPFVLEHSGEHVLTDLNRTAVKKSFLSSIVFLPVKERLTNPVTVSFKLTPT